MGWMVPIPDEGIFKEIRDHAAELCHIHGMPVADCRLREMPTVRYVYPYKDE